MKGLLTKKRPEENFVVKAIHVENTCKSSLINRSSDERLFFYGSPLIGPIFTEKL